MKKIIIFFLLALCINAFAQTEDDVLKQANSLIENKKYESAFLILEKYDSTNVHPNIVLMKESILLNYFVSSIGHLSFALKDIEKTDNIIDHRGKEGNYTMRIFLIDSILNTLITKEPNNCSLYKGLADYYFEVYHKYGEKSYIPQTKLNQLILDNYQKAISGNCADFLSYYAMGLMHLHNEKYNESISLFLRSIELNENYPDSYYDLAYSYTLLKETDKALPYALNAYKLYNNNRYRSDAAKLIGSIYFLKNDTKSSVEYYEKADNLMPNDYNTMKPLLELYLKTNSSKLPEYTKRFLLLDPFNPTIYNDLTILYIRYGKNQEIIDFLKQELKSDVYNDIVKGNFNFYLGALYKDRDKSLSKKYYTEANNIFQKFYPKDHKVFEAIAEALKQ